MSVLRSTWALGLLAFTLAALAACGGGAPKSDAASKTYSVRGMVRDLPREDQPTSNFSIHHEAIDDFVSPKGEVVGMSSMTMPFPVAEDLDLNGLAIGDPVEMTLVVDWEAEEPVLVTDLQKLPKGTELEFRKAKPAKPPE